MAPPRGRPLADEFDAEQDLDAAFDAEPSEAQPVPVTPAAAPAPAAEPAPADPGLLRTLGSNLLQGFFKGGSDEAAAALGTAGFTPDSGAYLRMPDGTERQMGTTGDAYRAQRDRERQVLSSAMEARPKTSFAAQLLGDVGSDAVLSTLGVPGVGTPGYNVLMGGLSGFLGSDAEATPDAVTPGSAFDAAQDTAFGAALGYAVPRVVQRFLRSQAVQRGLGAAGRGLRALGVDRGRRALLSGADSLTVNRKPVSDEAVEEALRSGAIIPGGTAKGAAQRLERLAEERGAMYSAIVQRAEELGVKGPAAEELAERLMKRYYEEAPNRMITSNIDPYMESAERLLRLGKDTKGGRIGFAQAEKLKQDLQEAARRDYSVLKETSLGETRKDVASILRQAVEDELEAAAKNSQRVGPLRKTPEARAKHEEIVQLNEEFVPVKQQLGRTLEARDAAQRGATRSMNRGSQGLIDAVEQAGSPSADAPWLARWAWREGNRALRERMPSTVASGSYWAGQGADALASGLRRNPDAVVPQGVPLFGGLPLVPNAARAGVGTVLREYGDEPRPPSQDLQRLAANPESMGQFGPGLANAAAEGPDALITYDYMMSNTNPEYARLKRQAAGAPTP